MTREKVITLGCRLNSYESEVIKNIIDKENLQDIAVFNTCCVTNEAERQAVQAIRKYKREHPDVAITVTGCAAHINPSKYSKMPEVARVIGNKEKLLAKSYTDKEYEDEPETTTPFLYSFETKTRALMQIQNGCNHRCSFCIIPYTRGPSKSVPIDRIIDQVKLFVDQGHVEVVLTGINITSYGNEFTNKLSLGQAVKQILHSIPDLNRLRLSSIDVSEIDDDLFELIKGEARFMPHLHLSLQAGDNVILRKMRRRHTREQVIKFCETVRKSRPHFGFGADIITGFPSETEEQFVNTCDLIKELKIPYLHVFPYSERYDTPASRMPPVDKRVRKDRAKILRHIGKNNLDEFSIAHIGKSVEVLLENNEFGRMENFLKVVVPHESSQSGQRVMVKILAYKDSNLIGEII